MLLIYKLDGDVNDKPVCILQEGEHIIGRGDLLRCNDQRASRTHASVNIKGGNATITSTHQNPCFFQLANSKTVTILSKDVPMELEEGDKFGIFPDQFWFRVKFQNDNDNTNNNAVTTEANSTGLLRKRSLDDDDNDLESKILKLENPEDLNIINNTSANEQTTNNAFEGCKLTDSLNKMEELLSDFGKNEIENGAEKSSINDLNNATSSPRINQAKESQSDDEIKVLYNLELPKEELSDSDNEHTDGKNEAQPKVDNLDGGNMGTNTEMEKVAEATPSIKDCVSDDKTDDTNMEPQKADEAVPSTSGNVADNVDNANKVTREGCWYGNTCYRKNADHRKEFSHPGDSDYESDPSDTRPYCKYGADCYRKNKDHRDKFKHPKAGKKPPAKVPTRKKRDTTKKNKAADGNDSPEDDYDYDDPFFNDDSDDEYAEESWSEYDDSDDEMTDSQNTNNQGDEDTKTLMKEARRFTKEK